MSNASSPSSKVVPHTSVWHLLRNNPLRIALIGSGNWASAIAKIIGLNAQACYFFETQVRMYVYEEEYQGQPLSRIINSKHENVKYLPGVKLPPNVVAVPDLLATVADAQILVFCVPHQFLRRMCLQMQGHIAPGAIAVSLVKGFDCEGGKINLMSEQIRQTLGIECCSLSGANVAEGVAREEFSESTIGYDNIENAQVFQQLFHAPWFQVNAVPDVAGVEICGSLKNVVALGAGFIDGLGYGSNTKAAILRIGLLEMRKFAGMFYAGTVDETFWDSAGFADLLTTCYGGRNRRCAEQFVRTGKSWQELERTMLNGQKLQGTHTARDVHAFLTAQGPDVKKQFPLFNVIYDITDCGADPRTIITSFMSSQPRPITKTRTLIRSTL